MKPCDHKKELRDGEVPCLKTPRRQTVYSAHQCIAAPCLWQRRLGHAPLRPPRESQTMIHCVRVLQVGHPCHPRIPRMLLWRHCSDSRECEASEHLRHGASRKLEDQQQTERTAPWQRSLVEQFQVCSKDTCMNGLQQARADHEQTNDQDVNYLS